MEIQFLQWVDATFHSQAWLNYIMKYITYIGEFRAGAIICALWLLIFKKTRWAGVAVGLAGGGGPPRGFQLCEVYA
ncbi:MAG: hypothetical protein K2I20_02395, partial [Clostridia bacterium]|nr:hypothetical protein [Clostridia bacterium]